MCSRETGEKEKKKAREGRWEGEKERKPFPSSHRPSRAFYFSIIALGYPARTSAEERALCGGHFGMAVKKRIHHNQ